MKGSKSLELLLLFKECPLSLSEVSNAADAASNLLLKDPDAAPGGLLSS